MLPNGVLIAMGIFIMFGLCVLAFTIYTAKKTNHRKQGKNSTIA